MATWPSTEITTSLASTSRARRGAGEDHGLAERLTEGRDPEIALELREGLGKGLRDRPGAEDRPDRCTRELGGDGS